MEACRADSKVQQDAGLSVFAVTGATRLYIRATLLPAREAQGCTAYSEVFVPLDGSSSIAGGDSSFRWKEVAFVDRLTTPATKPYQRRRLSPSANARVPDRQIDHSTRSY
jgi:hypothetical protein